MPAGAGVMPGEAAPKNRARFSFLYDAQGTPELLAVTLAAHDGTPLELLADFSESRVEGRRRAELSGITVTTSRGLGDHHLKNQALREILRGRAQVVEFLKSRGFDEAVIIRSLRDGRGTTVNPRPIEQLFLFGRP